MHFVPAGGQGTMGECGDRRSLFQLLCPCSPSQALPCAGGRGMEDVHCAVQMNIPQAGEGESFEHSFRHRYGGGGNAAVVSWAAYIQLAAFATVEQLSQHQVDDGVGLRPPCGVLASLRPCSGSRDGEQEVCPY